MENQPRSRMVNEARKIALTKEKFTGVFTALVTPFNEDESIDWDSLANLIEFNIQNGVTGIVPCGTTGESPTLSPKEHDEVVSFTINYTNGRVPIIAGAGSNSTTESIHRSRHAEKAGADGLLLVTPYYNKPTQEGLYRHFKKINDNVGIPFVVYNIPGRSVVNIQTDTLLRIIDGCKNAQAVKEASGNLEQIEEVIDRTPDYFSVLSGDDGIALKVIEMGGQGVISVASNLIPSAMSELIYSALYGSMDWARVGNENLESLFNVEFIETNPQPIKYMLSLQGRCNEVYRLPMCELSEEHKKEVQEVMQGLKNILE